MLAPDELNRAARFHFERDASRFIVGRGVLRRLLASYQSRHDPRDILLSYGPYGKPALESGSTPAAEELRFNLAHSGGIALFAFARSVELGVDVERVHDLPDMSSVMRSSFAAAERAEIAALAPGEQLEAFFRCWSRKEAVLKSLGWGLAKPLDSFEVSMVEKQPRLISMAGVAEAQDRWRMLHLNPAPGFIGAAAWVGPALTAECYAYEP